MDKEQSKNGSDIGTGREQGWPTRAAAASSQRQRTCIRKASACLLQVRIGQSHILTQSAHDLSLTGVFVEMNPDSVLLGDQAEVLIGLTDNNGRPHEHRITAEVVRIQPEGVALKFDQYDNRAYTDLVNFLYG